MLAVIAVSLARAAPAGAAAPAGGAASGGACRASGYYGRVDGECTQVKSAPNYLIALPNPAGAAHRYDFFGNAGVDAHSTYDSLKGVTSTNSASQVDIDIRNAPGHLGACPAAFGADPRCPPPAPQQNGIDRLPLLSLWRGRLTLGAE